MNNRLINVMDAPTTTENLFLEIEVYYSEGGMNFFNYSRELKGIKVSVRPVTIKKGTHNTFSSRMFNLSSGACSDVIQLTRFNRKKLEECAKNIIGSEVLTKLIAHVLNENKHIILTDDALTALKIGVQS